MEYREIKARQAMDLKSGKAEFYFYRHLSTPFTWLFVRSKIQPNSITILTCILPIVGFCFLTLGNYLSIAAGLSMFILFKIFDMADGEVARLTDKKSVEGIYLDRISHYIFSCFLGFGLGIGIYKLYGDVLYVILGFLLSVVFILENALNDLLRSFLVESLVKGKDKKIGSFGQKYRSFRVKLDQEIYSGKSWHKSSIFTKIFGIVPFQGLFFSDTFIVPLLIISLLADYMNHVIFSGDIFYFTWIYMLVVTLSKSIWLSYFFIRLKRNMHITKTLKNL